MRLVIVNSVLCASLAIYHLIFPNFQNCACCEKDWKDNKHNSLHMGRNMLGYLSLEIICSSENCSLIGQIISADKYPSLFSHQMEAIVYIQRALALNSQRIENFISSRSKKEFTDVLYSTLSLKTRSFTFWCISLVKHARLAWNKNRLKNRTKC